MTSEEEIAQWCHSQLKVKDAKTYWRASKSLATGVIFRRLGGFPSGRLILFDVASPPMTALRDAEPLMLVSGMEPGALCYICMQPSNFILNLRNIKTFLLPHSALHPGSSSDWLCLQMP